MLIAIVIAIFHALLVVLGIGVVLISTAIAVPIVVAILIVVTILDALILPWFLSRSCGLKLFSATAGTTKAKPRANVTACVFKLERHG